MVAAAPVQQGMYGSASLKEKTLTVIIENIINSHHYTTITTIIRFALLLLLSSTPLTEMPKSSESSRFLKSKEISCNNRSKTITQ